MWYDVHDMSDTKGLSRLWCNDFLITKRCGWLFQYCNWFQLHKACKWIITFLYFSFTLWYLLFGTGSFWNDQRIGYGAPSTFNHHDFHNCHQAFTIFWKETSINVVVVVWIYASSIGIPYGGELKRSFLQSQERWSILQRCRTLERVVTESAERDNYWALLYCKRWAK